MSDTDSDRFPSYWVEYFRENLRTAIEYRETTLTKLAKRTGMSQPSLSHFVNGKQDATLGRVSRLADALSIPLPRLFEPPSEFRRWIREHRGR